MITEKILKGRLKMQKEKSQLIQKRLQYFPKPRTNKDIAKYEALKLLNIEVLAVIEELKTIIKIFE